MSATEAGFRYPDIVRAGIHLVLDTPAQVEIRVDPDGERKADERRRRNEEWRERLRASGERPIEEVHPDLIARLPPLKTIHLQWLDTGYGKETWRDVGIHIDLERRRIHNGDCVLLGGGHKGSGALGVVLFALPVLVTISPYLYVRYRQWRLKERKNGMSRHAVSLMEKLKGQLDAETESLLREAFRNDWAHWRKMSRVLSFLEASALLDACDLTERRLEPVAGDALRKELIQEFVWRDVDGDMVGHVQLVGGKLHHGRFLGSAFEEPQVLMLLSRFRSRRVAAEDEE